MKTQLFLLAMAVALVLMPSCVAVPTRYGPALAFDQRAVANLCNAAVIGAVPPQNRRFAAAVMSSPRPYYAPASYAPAPGHYPVQSFSGNSSRVMGHSVYNRRPSYYQPGYGNPAWNARFGGCTTPSARSPARTFINGRPCF